MEQESLEKRIADLENRLANLETTQRSQDRLIKHLLGEATGETLGMALTHFEGKLSVRLYNCICNKFGVAHGTTTASSITLLEIVKVPEDGWLKTHNFGIRACLPELKDFLQAMGLRIAMTPEEIRAFIDS